MKIINNPALIQKSNNSSIIDKKNNTKSDIISSDFNPAKDYINIIKHDVKNVTRVNSLQKDLSQSQRMFGALTLLSEAIKSFQEKPSIQKQNIQRILEDIKNESPALSSALSKNINNLSAMTRDITQKSKDIHQQINSHKKEISQYLIMEQNKDALSHRSISIANIPNKLDQSLFNNPINISPKILS